MPTPTEWRAMFETNVIALLAGCQAAVQAMRKTGSQGHIVNISSVAATTPRLGRLRLHQARRELHLAAPCATSSRTTTSAS